MSEVSEIQAKLYSQCAVKKCSRPMQPNAEGGLDLTVSGGYGDFIDSYDGEINTFRLCHRHSHKFAKFLNNSEVLPMYWGHSHNGSEPGFWYGHPSWEQQTWLSYVTIVLHSWYKQGWKSAKYFAKEQFRSHKTWSRVNINDKTTPVQWGKFFYRLFFLNNAHRGWFTRTNRYFKSKMYQFTYKYYRKHSSLYNELWKRVLENDLSHAEKALIIDLGASLADRNSLEEE